MTSFWTGLSKGLLTGLLLTALLAAGACGRKGPPVPPEGEEANYTFPQAYPAPEDTLGIRTEEGRTEDEAEVFEEGEEPVAEDKRPLVKAPEPGYRFEGDGYARSKSLTY